MPTFTFTFEDLPLVVVTGFDAGLVAGSAEIEYERSDVWNWCVVSISLDGHRPFNSDETRYYTDKGQQPAMYHKHSVPLDDSSPLYAMILHRLVTEWADKVHDAVAEEIEQERQYRADEYADMVRERRYSEAAE